MAGKVYSVRQAFNSGEVSANLVAFRDDVSKYASACLTLETAVPLVEGGAKKMPGSYFAGTTAQGGSMFNGFIGATTLTVVSVNFGVIRVGQPVIGPGVSAAAPSLQGLEREPEEQVPTPSTTRKRSSAEPSRLHRREKAGWCRFSFRRCREPSLNCLLGSFASGKGQPQERGRSAWRRMFPTRLITPRQLPTWPTMLS